MKRMLLVVSSLAAVVVFATVSLAPSLEADQRGQTVGPEGGRQGAAAGGGRGRGPQVPAGPTPRLSNGKPDLSGLWANPYTPNMAGRGALVHPMTRQPLTFARQGERLTDAVDANRTFDLPYTDWGLKQWKTYDPANQGDYAGNCLPFGTARNLNAPHGLLIIHNNDALAFLFEQDTWFHWVPTMPSFKWPADLPPSWSGVSTGRWEGDTLSIETTGFNGYTKLDTTGHPHSNQLTLINTFTRTDSRTMQHTMTVRDPKTFTQEWMNVRTWRIRDAPDVIMEYSCDENNLHNILDGVIKVWKPPADVD
jgi:hypothetical protein